MQMATLLEIRFRTFTNNPNVQKMKKNEAIEAVKQPKQNYYLECFQFAKHFIRYRKQDFTSEDVIDHYNATKNKIPTEPRVWGAIFNELQKLGLIEQVGFVPYRKASGHGKPTRLWKKK